MGQKDILQTVAIQIRHRDTHAGLSESVFIECDTREQRLLLQYNAGGILRLSIAAVRFQAEEKVRLPIICHINFRSSATSKVADGNTQ